MKSLLRVLVATAVTAAILCAPARAAEHPSLVDPSSTNCSDCHDDLWPAGAAVHPPAEDDCTTCHEFSKTEGGMQVGFIEAGVGLCLMCHDEMSAAAEADLETPHFPVTDDCASCHNPHGSTTAPFLKGPVKSLCADCHDMDDLNESHGGQLSAEVRCQTCHDVHGGPNAVMLRAKKQHAPFAEGSCKACHRPPMAGRVRLSRRGEKLCLSCHGNLLTEGHVRHAATFARGESKGCTSCHDPHMSNHSRLLVAPGPEVCRDCHSEVVELGLGEGGHPPVADDCTNCHNPHDAEHGKLLVEPAGEICAMCHDNDDAGLQQKHLGADLAKLRCTSCHTPHGSEHGHLLAENVHPPVLDGCDTCHDETFDRWYDDPPALCEMCHDDVTSAAAAAEVQHAALELGSCVDCHNPHASAQAKLIKSPGGGPCLDCHDDMGPGEGEVVHGIIDQVGCRACHEPHGGSRAKLLRATGNELCLTCHDSTLFDPEKAKEEQATTVTLFESLVVPIEVAAGSPRLILQGEEKNHGHPVSFHRTLGVPTEEELKATKVNFSGELTCRTCHDPHKGKGKGLFVGGAVGHEICLNCHEK